jgi:serine/threonine-protein kinase
VATVEPSVEHSLVGSILSKRFRLKQELGRGGMGTVYAAEPLDGGPVVAIKILNAIFSGDAQVLHRFLEEGRTCMRLVHPNILRVHECRAADDGSPYLVMDLLEGVPLSAYTRNGGRVSLAHAAPILQGILTGLEAAHAEGVVHRDLKPGNVFLARDPEGRFVVKLLDFGIAKVMDVAGGMGNKTKTGMLLGTPAYMSPEQIRSAKDVDARADLWSAGVMFYEMLTGRVAFPAPTEYARLVVVLQHDPPPVESLDLALARIGPFVTRAMQKDRAQRFQTAHEMSDALRDALTAEPLPRPGDPARRAFVAPLSRLPDRAWSDEGSGPARAREERAVPDPVAPGPATGGGPAPGSGSGKAEPSAPSSSTLASAGHSSSPPPGSDLTGSSHPGTVRADEARPSPQSPGPHRSGVRMWVVVLLVLFAFGAGVGTGFALADVL